MTTNVNPKDVHETLPKSWAELLELGFSVFPVSYPKKKPEISWKRYQSVRADLKTVSAWAQCKNNIGIATGAVSGLFVLDLDSVEAVSEAESMGLPPTLTVKSPRGLHVYFQHPGLPVKNKTALKPGWDIRGDGGYIMAPGSYFVPTEKEIAEGKVEGPYHWENPPTSFHLAAAPDWLLDLLAKDEAERKACEVVSPAHSGVASAWAETALRGELARLLDAPAGTRNDALNVAAMKLGQIVGSGYLDEGEVCRRLYATASAIGLDEAEIEPTIASGLAKGRSEPRHPPERETATARGFDPETGEVLDYPEPVDLWGQFNPTALPTALLPPLIEQWARVNAETMGADPAGLAMAAITTCAAAIPDSIKLKVKRHDEWMESARIWTALVGSPSTKKSPILSAASGPLCRLDVEMMRKWQRRVATYDALTAEEKKEKARPKQTRLRIEDATVEAAQQVLEGSHWGILLLQDELSGFFGSMDKYGGGKAAQADRAFWLRSFNGGPFAINRVGRGSAVIENLSVSMLGGIQPEPMRKISGDAQDDGLLQRLFPIMLRPATMGRDEPMPPVNADYADLIERLHAMRPPGWQNTGVLQFDDDAQAVRRELEAKHLELQSLETINRKLAAHIGKYDGLFARLCIIWHCVENADDPEALPETITAGTARRVADFLHGFLLAHSIAFYAGVLGLSDDHDRLTAIAGYILAHRLERVTNRDIARGDRTMRGLKDHEVRPLLEQLEALGWLERIEAPRPSSPPHFKVNPRVHELFAAKAESEARRRREARKTIAALMQ